jgi:hypothetical protein
MEEFDLEILADLHVFIPPEYEQWFLEFQLSVFIYFMCIWMCTNVPSEPGMQVRKSWCLLSSNWVGLGNAGGGAAIFKKSQ